VEGKTVEYNVLLGSAASLTAVVAYGIYLWKICLGSTKPHAFSWLIWGFTTGVVFFAQIIKGGGLAGASVTGVSSGICFVISYAAFKKGDREPTGRDYVYLVLSLASLPFWLVLHDPSISVLWLTAIDVLGYFPTIEKGRETPWEDSVVSFFLNSVKFIFGIAALRSLSFATWVTWVYPATLIIMNGYVAVTLLRWRLSTLSRKSLLRWELYV
jgi:hypothetical protein